MGITKLSLSKKGFDSENGRGPSVILRDGRMVPFPIPEPRDGVCTSTYGTISHDGHPLSDLLARLGYRVSANDPAHLDPDLIQEARERTSDWRGMLGQVDQAESHLRNEGVGLGSLFLFWGWFEREETNKAFHRSDGFSSLCGYLEVDHVVAVGVDPVPPYAPYHPHFADPYPRQRNRVYVAREKLSWNAAKPGWGVFHYHPRLRLSIEGKNRSNWRLPGCFHPSEGCVLTFNKNLDHWGERGAQTTVRIPGRGQEFVCSLTPDIERWAHEVIDETPIWTPIDI